MASADLQARLLRGIHAVTVEHTRVVEAGPAAFGGFADPETAWRHHRDALDAVRRQAEVSAIRVGVPPEWVADIGEIARRQRPPDQPLVREMPARTGELAQFQMDMLSIDLQVAERMAMLSAARADRIATGRTSFAAHPLTEAQFRDNLDARCRRIGVLATALELTEPETRALWGPGGETVRRVQAAGIAATDDYTLMADWHSYSHPSPDLAIPPYITAAPTATPVPGPTPDHLLTVARASVRAGFVDTALTPHELTAPTTAAVEAPVADAVEALPTAGEGVWDAGPDDRPGPAPPAPGPGIGPDP